MIQTTLSTLAQVIQADLRGADGRFTGISTDSRRVTAGQLFVALRGEHFDGHAHVEQALAKGAAAVLVEEEVPVSPVLKVQSTYQALGQLAAYWRAQMSTCKVLALTGSTGKTTLKEMLHCIALAAFPADQVLCTEGNLNNHIGVPLTLAQLHAEHRMAIIEAGMNHAGEIAQLTAWIRPDVAVVNNAGTAHIEYLGSRAAIAMAKSEIYQGLPATGVAVWNGDDAFAPYWQGKTLPYTQICFGRQRQTAPHVVQGQWQGSAVGEPMHISTPEGDFSVRLQVLGAHQRHNALAATAGALALGIPLAAIQQGLGGFVALPGRGAAWHTENGACVIDDTYNANPDSMRAAIDLLAQCQGPKFLVLGQMGELGGHSQALHQEVLDYAWRQNFTAISLYGAHFANLSPHATVRHFTSHEAIAAELGAQLSPDSTCLIKGSRTARMEQVLHALVPASLTHLPHLRQGSH
jgi:UDP-N-acetylmuramoyl-tripeptide--D-alanyl-D-alanine ligase